MEQFLILQVNLLKQSKKKRTAYDCSPEHIKSNNDNEATSSEQNESDTSVVINLKQRNEALTSYLDKFRTSLGITGAYTPQTKFGEYIERQMIRKMTDAEPNQDSREYQENQRLGEDRWGSGSDHLQGLQGRLPRRPVA